MRKERDQRSCRESLKLSVGSRLTRDLGLEGYLTLGMGYEMTLWQIRGLL